MPDPQAVENERDERVQIEKRGEPVSLSEPPVQCLHFIGDTLVRI